MHKNFIRIIAGSVIGVAILTILLFLLRRTNLLITAYLWSVFAMIVFAISLGFWAKGVNIKYILNAAFPIMIKGYLAVTTAIAAIAVLLEICKITSMHCGWFSLIEFIVLAFFTWKILALDTGREVINNVEQNIKLQTVSWKIVAFELASVANRATVNDKDIIRKVADAARFADPMEHPGVNNEVNSIKELVAKLNEAVNSGNSTEIPALCTNIELLIKERAAKLLILK